MLDIVPVIAFYFLPAIIAGARRHRRWLLMLVLNAALGWTFIGWIALCIWSLGRVGAYAAHPSRMDLKIDRL